MHWSSKAPRWVACLLAVALALPAHAAVTAPTHEFTLDNGLKVLVREDHRAPVVTVMVWYGVGSAFEPPGRTGLSHLLEHMMFKGTRHLAPGEYSKIVARFGGTSNAFTTYDYTVYFQQHQVSRLPLALELEAERMKNLQFTDEAFYNEVQVVLEERRQRIGDHPIARARVKFGTIQRPGTGYAHPIIGWERDLRHLTPEMAREWYKRYYHPGNAVLVIAGDVQLQPVRKMVKRFFAEIPSHEAPPGLPEARRPVPGERRMTLHLPVRVPNLRMSWNVPSLVNLPKGKRDTYYELVMLAGILDASASARLPSTLIREQEIATSVSAGYQGLTRGSGLFSIIATPNPGVSLQKLETAIMEQIRKLKKHPPKPAELQRVLAQVVASNVYQQDSLFSQAMQLGLYTTLGLDWRLAEKFVEKLRDVTPKEVQQVAQEYLVPARSAVAWVKPEAK